VNPDELLRKIDAGEAPVIVDVRTSVEYAAGHVPGAIHAPFQSLRSHLAELPTDRDAPVIVYCGHGPRAYIAGVALGRLGFRNLAYLKGHMARWRRLRLREEQGSTAI
jgi:rhodanese-related sulfurtransferase